MRPARNLARSRLKRFFTGLALVAIVSALALPAEPASAMMTDARSSATTSTAERSFFVPVAESPGSAKTIDLDVTLYTPAITPAPAVLLAHGFGQTKAALVPEAKKLQAAGYVVLAYTARGFGRSGGSIGLDSLDGEVPDARSLITVLANNSAVEKKAGDPLVGVVGGSYGGALALMVGATDPRVDTVVAAITWNNLANALVPPSAGTVVGSSESPLRDFKSGWVSRLFGAGITPTNPCGRFTPQFCALYTSLIAGKAPSAADLALLRNSSPSTVLAGSHAPTLLLQGLQDNLFGLDQADANERQLTKAGAPVQVEWFDGGHDGGGLTGTDSIILSWLADHLKVHKPVPASFSYAVPASATAFGRTITAARYPGLAGSSSERQVSLSGPAATIVNPPGGEPASVIGLPGFDAGSPAGSAITSLIGAANPSAERARFVSAPLTSSTLLAGAATVRLDVAPAVGTTAPTDALLYAQLSVTTGDATRVLPGGVAPIRVTIPPGGATVAVRLPATVWSFTAGDRLALTIRTSDSQFQGALTPAAYRVSLDGPISLPGIAAAAIDSSAGQPSVAVLVGIGVTLLVALILLAIALVLGRRGDRTVPTVDEIAPVAPPSDQGPPLQIRGLTKRFRSGFLAVDDVSFTVERGQVLGLLGENGAGKTTTLRMVAGLIHPDSGTASSFGAVISAGSPVLARLGCFIEGPGFLPHLSGRRNLELYWAATGRPRREALFDEVLTVADLGAAISKPVRGYSQGMRQRLAIAQAMLGMPDLLVLDEPTNGLDPPQITALRGVLRRYAESGRTVIVSSHLLGEVELTCSHVVVMSHGRVVASGPVGEIAGDSSELLFGVTDVATATVTLRDLGVDFADGREPGTLRVTPGSRSVDALVAALVEAGVGITGVQPGRHLEEAFLSLIGAKEPSA